MACSVVRVKTIGPELVTLAKMKNWLRVDQSVTADDDDITGLIQEARMQAELISNACLVRSKWVQYHDHFPGWRLGYGASFDGAGIMTGPGLRSGYGDSVNINQHPLEIKIKRPPLVSVLPITFIDTNGRPNTLNPGEDFVVDLASRPGRIRPIPFTVWPVTLPAAINAVAIPFISGFAPNADALGGPTTSEPETSSDAIAPSWKPGNYPQYSYLIDPSGNVEVQMNPGNPATGAGPAAPVFAAIGGEVADGGCLWQNFGPIQGTWMPGQNYASPCVLLDYNSNLQLLMVPQLTSQTIPPYSEGESLSVEPLPWGENLGAFTTDNGIVGAWMCIGPYNAMGNLQLVTPNTPEQQAAYTQDYTLPRQVTRFIKALVSHWYYNREPVVSGSTSTVPYLLEDMLGEVTVHDFNPTP